MASLNLRRSGRDPKHFRLEIRCAVRFGLPAVSDDVYKTSLLS